MKELARYGHQLKIKIQNGSLFEIVIIFMGKDALDRASSLQPFFDCTLALPFLTSPTRYFWPLTNCEVYLVDTNTSDSNFSFVQFCAACFFAHGAKIVHYISSTTQKDFTHER